MNVLLDVVVVVIIRVKLFKRRGERSRSCEYCLKWFWKRRVNEDDARMKRVQGEAGTNESELPFLKLQLKLANYSNLQLVAFRGRIHNKIKHLTKENGLTFLR